MYHLVQIALKQATASYLVLCGFSLTFPLVIIADCQ